MLKIWISWEDHRRSRELSKAFQAKYFPLLFKKNGIVRYIILSYKTIKVVFETKPDVVFCQNPSIVLASLLVFIKPLFGYRLAVDRHSNFKLDTLKSKSPKWIVFHFLSKYTIRNSNYTIVTNEDLHKICIDWGGRPYILQDKIPTLEGRYDQQSRLDFQLTDLPQVLFVTTYESDEPINEILIACDRLKDVACYLSGNYKKKFSDEYAEKLLGNNTVLTGFLAEHEYVQLLKSCDVIVVLTKRDFILNCGAYEAVSENKRLIISNTESLRNYFGELARYVDPLSAVDIEKAIRRFIENGTDSNYCLEYDRHKNKLLLDWKVNFDKLVASIGC